MDWESKTTKKHIEEAEAQGCKLVGVGKDRKYRLYALPCGHRQELQLGHMRAGNFTCSLCMASVQEQEAEAQGCKLLGPGKSAMHRLYALHCGHEQQVTLLCMRKGSFECRTCLDKKFVQEAEAQGCKLLGPGKDANYRLYALPCGHEQQVGTGAMRKGGFRCSICLANKLRQEAEAQGCKLLGAGRNKDNRIYTLSCGHTQEVTTRSMRTGSFRCADCLKERLRQEAEAQGCKLLRAGRNAMYRLYSLPCAHEQEITLANMRIGTFRCAVCLAKKLKQEAEAQGCILLGAGSAATSRTYSLPCGHEQVVHTVSMREGIFECKTCMTEKHRREALAQGCKLLGAGKTANHRLYKLPCGHEQQVEVGRIRIGEFGCQTCLAEKLAQEAEVQGCKLIGTGKNKKLRLYELSCGHEQQVQVAAMRIGSFLCQTCEETSRTLPSNVYLLHIKVDSDEWLKLGYAKSVDLRVSQYGLLDAAEVTTVVCLPFGTGNEAHAVEANLHKRYKRKRLTRKQMEQFHTKGGFEECYPVTMLETLLAELEALESSPAT